MLAPLASAPLPITNHQPPTTEHQPPTQDTSTQPPPPSTQDPITPVHPSTSVHPRPKHSTTPPKTQAPQHTQPHPGTSGTHAHEHLRRLTCYVDRFPGLAAGLTTRACTDVRTDVTYVLPSLHSAGRPVTSRPTVAAITFHLSRPSFSIPSTPIFPFAPSRPRPTTPIPCSARFVMSNLLA